MLRNLRGKLGVYVLFIERKILTSSQATGSMYQNWDKMQEAWRAYWGPMVWGLQVGVVTDIRGRRSTAEAMHLCDKALAATSEAIVITDPNCADNPIVYCNAGFEKLTGGRAVLASAYDLCATL